ncbi:MAG: GNAT family N-acetyltransferase [Rhizobiaceae bacterium]
MAISFTAVEPLHLDWIETVAPEVFDYPLDQISLQSYLGTSGHILIIAQEGDLVVGQLTAVVHTHPDHRPKELYIDEVGVSPAYQRRGIATKLIELAFEKGRASGCIEAWLGTELDNLPANALYEPRAVEVETVKMYVFKL